MGRSKKESERLRRELSAAKREIAKLKRELSAAKREIAKLKRELSASRQGTRNGITATNIFFSPWRQATAIPQRDRLAAEAQRLARRFRASSLFRYLWITVTESAPATLFYRLWLYLRRVKLIQTVLSLTVAVGTLAAVAALWVAVLPFLILGVGGLTLWISLRARRMSRRLEESLAGQRIRVLIPSRGKALRTGSFFIRWAQSMGHEEGVTVLVISPYLLSPKGLGGKGFFLTARKEADGVYILRRHYYFALRRRVLDGLWDEITVVY